MLKKLLLSLCLLLPLSSIALAEYPDREKLLAPIAHVKSPNGSGSGFFTDATHVVTARHVVEMLGDLKGAYIFDSSGGRHRVVRIQMSYDADVAMIEVDSPNPDQAVAKVQCRMPQVFETLLVVGDPLVYENIISPIMIVGFSEVRDIDDATSVVAAGAVGEGMSGGPAFDSQGNVVAIVSSIWSTSQGGLSSFTNFVPLIAVPELCPPMDPQPEAPPHADGNL
jgi:S1-C subfamily serine protease